jgi:hypothetical protein
METTKNSDTGESKENKQSNTNQNTNAGFDFTQLLKDKNLAEILKHLLSGGGAMGGSYFIWIKPIQDKMEAMSKTIDEQETRIKELEKDQEKLFEKLEGERNESINGFMGKENEFFNIKSQNASDDQYFRKTRRAYF